MLPIPALPYFSLIWKFCFIFNGLPVLSKIDSVSDTYTARSAPSAALQFYNDNALSRLCVMAFNTKKCECFTFIDILIQILSTDCYYLYSRYISKPKASRKRSRKNFFFLENAGKNMDPDPLPSPCQQINFLV
jgi:hypothetical protein